VLQFFFSSFPFIFKRGGCLFSLIVMSFVPSVLCPEPARPPASALPSALRPPCHPPCARPSSARHLPVLCPLSALSPARRPPILRPAPARPLSSIRLSSLRRPPTHVLEHIRVPWVSLSRSHRPPLQRIILRVSIRYSAQHSERYSDRCSVGSIACATACTTDCSRLPARLTSLFGTPFN